MSQSADPIVARSVRAPGAAEFGAPAQLDASAEFDAPAEVDAAFRTQRRIALGYLAVFLVVLLATPVLALSLRWWVAGRLLGGMTPNFAFVAIGLYLFFFLLGLAAATLANAVEDRMLGKPGWGPGPERPRE